MKLLIAGVGHLGSQIAMVSAMLLRPEKIILYDTKPLHGDILDLQHACKGLGLGTEITERIEAVDYVVITAGAPYRSSEEEHSHKFYTTNLEVIKEVIHKLSVSKAFGARTKLIVMTNPVIEITEEVKKLYPKMHVSNPEKHLMDMRDGKELGMEIIKTKGYTSFGAAISCVKQIEELKT
jgi:malate/lactate dehydrogenase